MVVSSFQLSNKMNKHISGDITYHYYCKADFKLIKGIIIWITFKMQLIPILYDATSSENRIKFSNSSGKMKLTSSVNRKVVTRDYTLNKRNC